MCSLLNRPVLTYRRSPADLHTAFKRPVSRDDTIDTYRKRRTFEPIIPAHQLKEST
ncbi:hypothetical protein DIQ79_16550 [Mycolicibacterium smegmatis]|uniref:Uncharacterized protein n=1 Tax=Mycolicibacterium smegmatis (strain ATCC 700084 / mc(2)155) TaxID=246196 RepID=A0R328_MYCS2|nr:hypothetical protein MSMEG_5320 [Mycolicibacterium smegmatis MC2 155]TBM50277.1 hypothetical protein DIQ85_15275 [Mycolicibacterium smegmatis]TBH45097.1 hypothetical protein EYS45_14300 [Mycolicibacterium smegmatis MC2 155]TBM50875.1 hypothetical protein DIQ86_07010 [Mycolicibacterium smegmatis]TBM61364.1 hypothetical protein DIQ83_15335 [Mycolicibacterium smegmatis]